MGRHKNLNGQLGGERLKKNANPVPVHVSLTNEPEGFIENEETATMRSSKNYGGNAKSESSNVEESTPTPVEGVDLMTILQEGEYRFRFPTTLDEVNLELVWLYEHVLEATGHNTRDLVVSLLLNMLGNILDDLLSPLDTSQLLDTILQPGRLIADLVDSVIVSRCEFADELA